MKTKKLAVILPVIAILTSCKMTDFNPFQEDGYVPVGLQTESIVRTLTSEEADILDDNLSRIDDYITGQSEKAELRSYLYSYFGDYAPDGKETMDSSFSYSTTAKTYNNNVKVKQMSEKENILNDYVDVTTTAATTRWTFLPTATTFETRSSQVVNGANAVVSTYNSGAYDSASDYLTRFGYGLSASIGTIITNATYLGANADDDIIVISRDSTVTELALSRNGLAKISANAVLEFKLTLYEPEDSDIPLYLPVQLREYIDYRVISEIYHDGEVIKYLDDPIVVYYQEATTEWMSQDYGNYTLGDIPSLPA